jgi:hypothetical protein
MYPDPLWSKTLTCPFPDAATKEGMGFCRSKGRPAPRQNTRRPRRTPLLAARTKPIIPSSSVTPSAFFATDYALFRYEEFREELLDIQTKLLASGIYAHFNGTKGSLHLNTHIGVAHDNNKGIGFHARYFFYAARLLRANTFQILFKQTKRWSPTCYTLPSPCLCCRCRVPCPAVRGRYGVGGCRLFPAVSGPLRGRSPKRTPLQGKMERLPWHLRPTKDRRDRCGRRTPSEPVCARKLKRPSAKCASLSLWAPV